MRGSPSGRWTRSLARATVRATTRGNSLLRKALARTTRGRIGVTSGYRYALSGRTTARRARRSRRARRRLFSSPLARTRRTRWLTLRTDATLRRSAFRKTPPRSLGRSIHRASPAAVGGWARALSSGVSARRRTRLAHLAGRAVLNALPVVIPKPHSTSMIPLHQVLSGVIAKPLRKLLGRPQISHAAHRLQTLRQLRTKLRAHAAHVDVHRTRATVVVKPPYASQQGIS